MSFRLTLFFVESEALKLLVTLYSVMTKTRPVFSTLDETYHHLRISTWTFL